MITESSNTHLYLVHHSFFSFFSFPRTIAGNLFVTFRQRLMISPSPSRLSRRA